MAIWNLSRLIQRANVIEVDSDPAIVSVDDLKANSFRLTTTKGSFVVDGNEAVGYYPGKPVEVTAQWRQTSEPFHLKPKGVSLKFFVVKPMKWEDLQ